MADVVKKPVTKKKIIEIRILESVYDSPDSDGEPYLIKRFRPDNPDCNSKDNFNKRHAMKCQDLIERYQRSFNEDIPTKIPPTNFRDLCSLKQGNIIDESCLNDWAKHLINVFNLSESVLYIPTYLYRYFFKIKMDDAEAEKLIRYLANNRAIKKDYILVGMPATPTNQHWTLGVIMLNVRKITVLDPVEGSPGIDSRHYTNLLRIALVAHKLGNIKLKLDQWKLYYPLNIPRTVNQVDAGVYVCYYIFKIAFMQVLTSLLDTNAKDFRRRIHYVLASAKEILPQGDSKKYPRETLSQYTQYLSHCFYPFSQYVYPQSFDALAYNSVPSMSLGECPEMLCAQALTSCSDLDQIKCISCRKYYHSKCVAADPAVDYFNCSTCSAMA